MCKINKKDSLDIWFGPKKLKCDKCTDVCKTCQNMFLSNAKSIERIYIKEFDILYNKLNLVLEKNKELVAKNKILNDKLIEYGLS